MPVMHSRSMQFSLCFLHLPMPSPFSPTYARAAQEAHGDGRRRRFRPQRDLPPLSGGNARTQIGGVLRGSSPESFLRARPGVRATAAAGEILVPMMATRTWICLRVLILVLAPGARCYVAHAPRYKSGYGARYVSVRDARFLILAPRCSLPSTEVSDVRYMYAHSRIA
ncbi:hypothetical protein BD413DRAFT_133690 [Trametes elegans]|nr:hypothetical protein BD413DRAFT_133690 [Trametes elegans]